MVWRGQLKRDFVRSWSTLVAEVVDHDNVGEELGRRGVDDTVHGTDECRPALVDKDENDTGAWQLAHLRIVPVLAPSRQKIIKRIIVRS